MFDEYRKSKEPDAWSTYEARYLDLMAQRRIQSIVPKEVIEDACLLCSEDTAHFCHRRLGCGIPSTLLGATSRLLIWSDGV